jgi:formylglycine-generating enzyme required for sulfatase activity
VEIPGGHFWMGAPKEEEGTYSNERPQHQVKVSSFFMGKYPITQAQWQEVASLSKIERDIKLNPSYFKFIKGNSCPVECVSWYEAVEFCQRLSRLSQQGYQYRLPSEAEWEYACRSFISEELTLAEWNQKYNQPFHFGEKISPALANYLETLRGKTTTVGRFQVANRFGLYDMHGNVLEWCADHWYKKYEDAPNDGSAWLSENKDNYRLLRGGSFRITPDYCRSAARYQERPNLKSDRIGLRVVASSRT